MVGDIIKIKAVHSFTLFPRQPTVLGRDEDTYGIVKWLVKEIIQGNIEEKEGIEVNFLNQYIINVTGQYYTEIDTSKEYTILAKEKEHPKYGTQYELIFYGELPDLHDIPNQKAILSEILTGGQIEEFYKVFDNPLEVIMCGDVEELKKVKGVGDYIANCIINRFMEKQDFCDIYIALNDYALTPSLIQKLLVEYKNPNKVIDIVKNNPYRLCYDVDGIGFQTADDIAMSANGDKYSHERIKAYIFYAMNELGESGFSYITAGELQYTIYEAFGGKENIFRIYSEEEVEKYNVDNNIAHAIKELTEEHILALETSENKKDRRVYLYKYYNLEKKIAYHLKRIQQGENLFQFEDWEEKVRIQENKQGWELTEEQYKGVETCLKEQLVFITGSAGTGKTSVLSCALTALGCMDKVSKYSFVQCSLSGKAAARMTEVTNVQGYTIHRLLAYNPMNGFKYNMDNQLAVDIFVVDEISLIGGEIFLRLLEAIPTGSKLIMLGDMGQLPSIGCMNLAYDIYHSNTVSTIELTKIHRQAQKSGIIVRSRDIREGKPWFKHNQENTIEVAGELKDMTIDFNKDKDGLREKILDYYKQYTEDGAIVKDIMDIQVLATMKERGEISVFNLNNDIQEYINPPSSFRTEIEVPVGKNKSFVIRDGDKVLCIRNDYRVETTNGTKTAIFNGWTGRVVGINNHNKTIDIHFPITDTTVVLNQAQIKKNIMLGYAITIHKAQGSSAKVIVGGIDYSTPPQMLCRELIYTLLTRAEKECVLVTQTGSLYTAINNSGVIDKSTFLQEFLDDNLPLEEIYRELYQHD